MPIDQRLTCNVVEDECNVIMNSVLYDDIRRLYSYLLQLIIFLINYPIYQQMFKFYRLCQIHNTIEMRPGPCITF